MQSITSYEYLNLLRLLFWILQAGNNESLRVTPSMYSGYYKYFGSGDQHSKETVLVFF